MEGCDVKKMVAVLLLVLGCVTVSGCATTVETIKQPNDDSVVSVPDNKQSNRGSSTELLNASLGNDGAYIFSSAHPSYTVNSSGEKTVMAILDQDAVDHRSGLYSLTTSCIGAGTLDIEFMVGNNVNNGTLECGSQPRSVIVSTRIEQTGNGLRVKIIPSKGSDAEIAYRVDIS
ncbi:hypothetical protein [Bifidobacterium vespertilionis]|uniref:Lipoprotein n=1 Tax=Bifidobacterium vespertilionis TaxID=2562524 RepID=A0A5J5DSQ6_9BIFI|nr:hypothetical protein [Bifidobacterium vespertilionis]KAA8816884.1 hypothetical protein EMO90_11025 [Bifidobacterium vespertilionis]KAA8821883.1 hypothetical protein EM848_09785 [Bifidobacterium vespertilionis]